jgi:hypothetical protein
MTAGTPSAGTSETNINFLVFNASKINVCTDIITARKICQWSVDHGRSTISISAFRLQSQRQIADRVRCVERVVQLCAIVIVDEYPMILPVCARSNDA